MRVWARLRDAGLRQDALSVARAAGYSTEELGSDAALRRAVENGGVDALLLEITSRADLPLLREVQRMAPGLFVIGVGGAPGVELVVDAFREGAADFLRMPFDVSCLERALAQSKRDESGGGDQPFLTQDPETLRLLEQLRRVAASEATISLVGESGTGKDLLARRIHRASARRAGPMVVVNCAGLTPDLAESELFGHVRGSFTGASESRPGLISAADGGTLVLDEVGDLSLALQPKLLRALQEREVLPVGGRTPHPVDIRVIVTTQRDLAAEVEAERFREDLYYRLDVVTLRIPPLRLRPKDIGPLAESFLKNFATATGSEPAFIDDEALCALQQRPFRGNVRELENLMRRCAMLFPGRSIELDPRVAPPVEPSEALPAGLRSLNLRDLERAAVIRSLEACGGNRTVASRALGISVRTLRNKIRLYELA